MFQTGLVSISFRNHSPEAIVGAVRAAGLTQIEWGSDVHAPAGDLGKARYLNTFMAQNGLSAPSYGSYYRLGTESDPASAILPYLASAKALGASVIRLWGGTCGSADLTDSQFHALVREGQVLARLAAEQGLALALECHNNTLTDDYACALRYMNAVAHPAMKMYWQPNQRKSYAYNLEAADALAPHTTHIHVFSWDMIDGELIRCPLAHHTDRWQAYLDFFRKQGGDHALLLEFMHDNRIETLAETARTLNSWVFP